MTLNQALKEKKKLIKKANELWDKFMLYNSVEVGSSTPYDARSLYKDWRDTTNQIVELKSKIHVANAPVYKDIFMISELKGMITKMRSIPAHQGMVNVAEKYNDERIVDMTSTVKVIERDNVIAQLEEGIEQIQQRLDIYNMSTTI